MNTFQFTGRLAAAPELTSHASGKVCRFRLIRNDYTGKDEATGERREDRVTAIPFTAFDSRAEAIADNCLVGDQLIITASIRNNDYIPSGGTEEDKVYGYTFRVESFDFGAPGAAKREQLAAKNRDHDDRGSRY